MAEILEHIRLNGIDFDLPSGGGSDLKATTLRYYSNLPDDRGEYISTFKMCSDSSIMTTRYWGFEPLDREVIHDDTRAYYARKNDTLMALPIQVRDISSFAPGETKSIYINDYVGIIEKHIGSYDTILNHNAPTVYDRGSSVLNPLFMSSVVGIAQYGLDVSAKPYIDKNGYFNLKLDVHNPLSTEVTTATGFYIMVYLPVGPYNDADRYIIYGDKDPAVISYTYSSTTGALKINAFNATSYKLSKVELNMAGTISETLVEENTTGNFSTDYMGGNKFIYKVEVLNTEATQTDIIYIGAF